MLALSLIRLPDFPRRPETPPRKPPDYIRDPQESPERARESPKAVQEASKAGREAPKTAPRGGPGEGAERTFRVLGPEGLPQEAPRNPQEPPRRPQESSTQPKLQNSPQGPQCILEATTQTSTSHRVLDFWRI